MLSYQPQCWGRDFGLSMDMACHKHPHWAAASSSREPSAPNRIDMSKRFVLIQDQSWLVVHSRSRSMRSCWLRRWRRLHCWARPRSSQRSERSAKVIRDSRRLVEFHRSGWATVDSSPIMATGHLRMLLLVQLSPIVQQEAESEKKEINKIFFSLSFVFIELLKSMFSSLSRCHSRSTEAYQITIIYRRQTENRLEN